MEEHIYGLMPNPLIKEKTRAHGRLSGYLLEPSAMSPLPRPKSLAAESLDWSGPR